MMSEGCAFFAHDMNDHRNPAGTLRGCKCPNIKGRNLIVCIDGTSNQFGLKNTNVVELYSHIIKDGEQLTYYNSGIGTYAKESWFSLSYLWQVFINKVDLLVAWNLKNIILGAYRWLSDQYREGDKIYLFGFSRGAYQARAIAAMIEKVGLLYAGNQEQIPFAYELYADLQKRKGNGADEDKLAEHFKKTFSRRNVRVHFVGAWDTVSSVGVVRGKLLPLTDSCEHICFFRHALALDERRVKFLPEYARGGESVLEEHSKPQTKKDTKAEAARPQSTVLPQNQNNPCETDTIRDRRQVHIKEVWFPGSHSDIGGGNRRNLELNVADTPLLWMANEAAKAGLKLGPLKVEWDWDRLQGSKPTESLGWFWWTPLSGEHCDPRLNQSLWRLNFEVLRPHLGGERTIVPGQKLHASLAFKPKEYLPCANFSTEIGGRPWNDLVGGKPWDDLIGEGSMNNLDWADSWGTLLELDLFDYSGTVDDAAKKLGGVEHESHSDILFRRLAFVALSNDGRQAISGAKLIPKLYDLLHSGKENVQKSSVHLLSRFANNYSLCNEICKTDAIATLTGIVKDSKRVHWTTLSALTRLTVTVLCPLAHPCISLTDILEHGNLKLGEKTDHGIKESLANLKDIIVPDIIDMLGSDATKQIDATDACSQLVPLREFRNMILHSSGPIKVIPTLTKMLTSDTNLAKCSASTLSILAGYVELRVEMVKEDIIKGLTDMLGSRHTSIRTSSAGALAMFALHDEFRATMPMDDISHIMSLLVHMLRSRNSDVQRSGASTLSTFAQYEDMRALMPKDDIVSQLTLMLSSEHSQVQSTGASTLSEFAQYEDMRALMQKDDIVSQLVHMLSSENSQVQSRGASTLSNFAQYEDMRALMLNDDIISQLVHMVLEGENSEVQSSGAETLSKFAQYEDWQALMPKDDTTCQHIHALVSENRGAQGAEYIKSGYSQKTSTLHQTPTQTPIGHER